MTLQAKSAKSASLLPVITPKPKRPSITACGARNEIRPESGIQTTKQTNRKSDKPDTDRQTERVKKKKRKRQVGICTSSCHYESVRRAAKALGFVEIDEQSEWTIFWTDCSVSLERCMAMKKYQRINHFPGMAEICRKDLLSRNLTRLQKLFPKDYSIFPATWVLPADQGDLLAFMRGKKRAAFICKPQSGCQGRGIFLTRRPQKMLKSTERYIVQQYISRPLLIDGFKFDLRIYALVTSCDPLRIYIFREGLARFATMQYSDPTNSNMDESCMHLTNYSINKHSEDFVKDEESGSKRKFSSVNKWLQNNGYDVEKLWKEIDDCVVKTLIAAHPVLQHNYRTCFPSHTHHSACFEILGFDVLIDRKMKVWLLEVNHSPSFHTDSKMDKEIKDQLLVDTFRILHVRASDKQVALSEDRRLTQQRLTQLSKSNSNQSVLKTNDKKTKFSTNKSEQLKDKFNATANEIKLWESKHLGGFRRVYPLPDGEEDTYQKFFEKTGSLYQTTASTKAREEAVRLQQIEIAAKSKANKLMDAGEGGRPRTKIKRRTYLTNRSKMANEKKESELANDISELLPMDIREEEEEERTTQLKNREALLRGLGMVELIYHTLHCTSGTIADVTRVQPNQNTRGYMIQGRFHPDNFIRPCIDMRCPARREHVLSLSVGGGECRGYRLSIKQKRLDTMENVWPFQNQKHRKKARIFRS